MTPQAVSVNELNQYVKRLLEQHEPLQELWVMGEISNLKAYSSGHWYFTLKDDKAALPAVMFSDHNKRQTFVPENGMQVLVQGHISLYPRDGKYQFYAHQMQPHGQGALWLAYEQLKQRLQAEGLFDQSRKRPLPAWPARIAIVTSPTGAALQDLLQILGRRCPSTQIVLCPVQVQGEGAAQQIANAIAHCNACQAADLLIVGRGGGSLEDLWAFNEEIVVRAVAASGIPTISAVGHESDTALTDFAADLRAPTPSAAAELAVPNREDLLYNIQTWQTNATRALWRQINTYHQQLTALRARPVLQRPEGMVHEAQQRLSACTARVQHSVRLHIAQQQQRLAALASKLHALSPLQVLARGYAIASKNNQALRSVQELAPGDHITLRLQDGVCHAKILEEEPPT